VSKHGPCRTCTEPAVAWLRFRDRTSSRLCQRCLNTWFDMADDQPQLEPLIWGWLVPPAPAAEDIAAWARDPRHHQVVADVLRREARINPSWLREFLARTERTGRMALV